MNIPGIQMNEVKRALRRAIARSNRNPGVDYLGGMKAGAMSVYGALEAKGFKSVWSDSEWYALKRCLQRDELTLIGIKLTLDDDDAKKDSVEGEIHVIRSFLQLMDRAEREKHITFVL